MFRKLLTLLNVCITTLTAIAQPYCTVKEFHPHDGLASRYINGMIQTKDQLLWIFTWNGLSCYDGYQFTSYSDVASRTAGQSQILSTNRLLSINESITGNIWCITYDYNIYLFDRRVGNYVDISSRINKKYGISFHTHRAFTTKKGHTWLLNVEKGGAIVCIDEHKLDSDDAITLYKPDDKPFLANELFWAYEDHKGKEYFFTDQGLVSIDGSFRSKLPFRYALDMEPYTVLGTKDGRICLFDEKMENSITLSLPAEVNTLGLLVQNNRNTFIAVTDAGFYVYNTKTHKGQLIATPEDANPVSQLRTFYTDSMGRGWLITSRGDILKINFCEATVERLPMAHLIPLLRQSQQSFFHEDRHRTLWVATEQGFFGYYDKQGRSFVNCPVRTNINQPVINRWYIDTQDNLWFSGNHNLAMVSFGLNNNAHVTNLQEVRSVMFDHQGRLWAGTKHGEIAMYDSGGTLLGYIAGDGRIVPHNVRFSTCIYCLYQDRKQRIWIGTKGDGLYLRDTDGKLVHYGLEHLPSNQIYDVHQDFQGRIWVATFEKGICLIEEDDNGGMTFSTVNDRLKNYPSEDYHKVRRITETRDSVIIVSACNGLVTFSEKFNDPGSIRFYAHKHERDNDASLFTSDVMLTFAANNDSVYIVTVGGGVQVVSAGALLSDRLMLNNAHWLMGGQQMVTSILQDKHGNIWTGYENSISMYERATQQLYKFGSCHLGMDINLTEAKPAFNPLTGQIAFATVNGFICFQPERLQEESFVPPLVFTGIQLHGEGKGRRMLHGDSLEINTDQRNLTIYFSALSYKDNNMIKYAYKLEGTDHDWNELGASHSITFNRFPAGHHRLLVKSTDSHGVWVDNVRTLHVYARPTFWETWWALLLYVLIGVSIVGLAFWIYWLHARNVMEHQLNEMKTKFFTDVSHKLRTPLTLIGGPVNQVLQEGGLTDTARNHLEMVERNAKRMLVLVNKMLTYSKEHHTYISDENIPELPEESNGSATNNRMNKTNENGICLLIVEDNNDLRQFLTSILQSDYHVIEACNGREGLEKAQTEHPDFILTDVTMPEMDGLEMVHRIKADKNISHTPIVILSAKASMDDRIEGLKAGVNDYITKPFSATYLKQCMANIIQNQRIKQQNYLATIKPDLLTAEENKGNQETEGKTLRLKATKIVDADKLLMEQLIDYIEDNISNSELKIEDLTSALCLGRSAFYNKVKTLVGMSPVELLRYIRVQHAEEMVAKSDAPFSQIAYAVGFSDPRYFGKCFKKQTGLTPTEYREQRANVEKA